MGIDYETSLETKLELHELLREGQTSTCDMKKKGGGTAEREKTQGETGSRARKETTKINLV